MRVVAAAIVFSLFGLSFSFGDDAGVLAKICDEVAASPLDKTRPQGVSGVAADKIDPKVAIPACEAAAKASPDNARVVFQLGRAYGAAKANESSRVQYERAEALGHALAANNLGAIYSEGSGVISDVPRAIKYFEKAADSGIGFAMKNLGNLYLEGKQVPQDVARAVQWFERGAAVGDVTSMEQLGFIYDSGKVAKKDLVEAREWYFKAANNGSAFSMFKVGYYNHTGGGGPKNLAEARRWYEKAIEAGYNDPVVKGNLRLLGGDRGVSSNRNRGRSSGGGGSVEAPDRGVSYVPPMRQPPSSYGYGYKDGVFGFGTCGAGRC